MDAPNNITIVPFPTETGYFQEETQKDQIYIHHTASDGNPYGVVEYWTNQKNKVSTSFIIARGDGKNYKDGDIIQCFGSKYWAWHLGLKGSDLVSGGRNSHDMNSKAIGIEICNWGYLVQKGSSFVTYAGSKIPASQITTYPNKYKGYQYYQKYTDAQLKSVKILLQYLCERYEIPTEYKGDEIFAIDKRCLMGESGIFTHTSCRKDKWDCHPQPELITMLKSL